jgi:N-acetylneuraminic acid mutarotase
VSRNAHCPPRVAIAAFLLSGAKLPGQGDVTDYVLSAQQIDRGMAFLGTQDYLATRREFDQVPTTGLANNVSEAQAQGLRWYQPAVLGTPAPARAGHGYCAYEGKIWIFGGNTGKHFTNDLYTYDEVYGLWESPVCKGDFPCPRAGHSFVQHDGQMYLFGGADMDRFYFNDCYRFNPRSCVWTKILPKGSVPVLRAGHSAVAQGNKMWIFGGEDASSCLSHLCFLDLDTFQWSSPATTGTAPTPCGGHSCVPRGKELWVFGGDDRVNYSNRLFVLDTERLEWREPVLRGTMPSPRGGHSCCVYSEDQMVVFGGLNDSGFLEDLAVFEFGSNLWKAHQVRGKAPAARSGHTAVMVGSTMTLFGGYDSTGFRADIHCLGGVTV